MTHNEYLYERSIAQLQLMAVDSTHEKFLKGKDKKIWENYLKVLKAQENFSNFLSAGRGKSPNDENE